MNLAERAIKELFPEKDEQRNIYIRYSGRFSPYNANVHYNQQNMTFSLSKTFLELSEEIRQGVVEHLLCKIYGEQRPSTNQDLYHAFMKHLSSVAKVREKDPYLLERFQEINEHYFNGLMNEPNIRWGQQAFRKLGHYEYSTDTIVISSIFKEARKNENVRKLLDFVIYHEMLHKKHRYNHKQQRARHHTRAFREDEQKWRDKDVEKKLKWFITKKRLAKAIGW